MHSIPIKPISLIVLLAGLYSCGSKDQPAGNRLREILSVSPVSTEDVAAHLQQVLTKSDSLHPLVLDKDTVFQLGELRKAYASGEYKALWVESDGVKSMADSLIATIEDTKWDGLDPEKYHYTALKEKVDAFRKSAQRHDEIPAEQAGLLDMQLTEAFLNMSRDMVYGLYEPNVVDSLWFNRTDTTFSAVTALEQVVKEGEIGAVVNQLRPQMPWYNDLRSMLQKYTQLKEHDTLGKATSGNIALIRQKVAQELGANTNEQEGEDSLGYSFVKQYQYYNGLGTTGKVDSAFLSVLNRSYADKASQIRYNLERSRWLTQAFRYPYVLVNVPQYRLYYYDSTETMHYTMRVVVGKTSRQTPQLDASISNVVFNPNWTVPPTILKKDVLPGVTSSGAAYLSRKGLKVYNMDGKPVDASTVTSDNYRRFIYRQDPGAGNALGSVKINMPNKWMIYMHDTPHRSDFQNRSRAQSSGCVRLHHPREFAAMLLNDPRKYSEEEIDTFIVKRKTVAVKPPQSVGVHIVYFTVFPDSAGNMCFVPDVYKRDNKFRKIR